MMNDSILIVDDDQTLTKMLAKWLRAKGYDIQIATSGRDGLEKARKSQPDLVVLDVMMPEMDGFETCNRLREFSDVPVLMLTAKTTEEDLIRGFQNGADDYVKKPFSFMELELRISAILKRANMKEDQPTLFDDGTLKIDLDRQHVYRENNLVHLTPTEYKLLSCLVRNQGGVISHEGLLRDVWGEAYTDATACLSLYIRYLREKLEANPSEPKYIRTKWGIGYWFDPNLGS
jgi:two-component system, OmpR family, response regulator VicR